MNFNNACKLKQSEFYFVDLAGSERVRSNPELTKKEGCHINKSLLVLGSVITSLVE